MWVLLHKLNLDICSLKLQVRSCRWWLSSYPAGRTARKQSRSVKSINVSGDKFLFFNYLWSEQNQIWVFFSPARINEAELGLLKESRSDQTCFGKVVLWLKLPVFPPMTRTVKSAGGGFLVTPSPPPPCLPACLTAAVCVPTYTQISFKAVASFGVSQALTEDCVSVFRRTDAPGFNQCRTPLLVFLGLKYKTKQKRRGEKTKLLIWHTLLWAMFLDPLSFLLLIATW